jgi:hypothetical protein
VRRWLSAVSTAVDGLENASQPLLLRRHDVASEKALESGSECLRLPHAATVARLRDVSHPRRTSSS